MVSDISVYCSVVVYYVGVCAHDLCTLLGVRVFLLFGVVVGGL